MVAVLSSFSQLVQEPGHTEAAGPQGRAGRGAREGETENKGGQQSRQRSVDFPIYLGMRICYKCVISMKIHVAVGGGGLVAKLCPTLCDPVDCSPPGSSVHGFSRQEHWNGCHFLLQGIFPIQGLNLFKNLFIYLIFNVFKFIFLLKDNCFTEFRCFFVKPQHESAVGIRMSPPFWTSLPSPSPSLSGF